MADCCWIVTCLSRKGDHGQQQHWPGPRLSSYAHHRSGAPIYAQLLGRTDNLERIKPLGSISSNNTWPK